MTDNDDNIQYTRRQPTSQLFWSHAFTFLVRNRAAYA